MPLPPPPLSVTIFLLTYLQYFPSQPKIISRTSADSFDGLYVKFALIFR